jgi:hypothetical protein
MEAFTDMVSLGSRCRGTRRFRDFYGTESAYPFDWWVTPMKGLMRALRDWDVEQLFDPAELSEVMVGEAIAYVHHDRYGLKFQHDFPTVEGRIRPDWRDHLEPARSRTRHLMDKFDALNRPGRRILFYREVSPTDAEPEGMARALKHEVRRRLPLPKCAFLLISRDGLKAQGWRSVTIDDPTEEPWTGDAAIWDAALAALDYRLQPASDADADRLCA